MNGNINLTNAAEKINDTIKIKKQKKKKEKKKSGVVFERTNWIYYEWNFRKKEEFFRMLLVTLMHLLVY